MFSKSAAVIGLFWGTLTNASHDCGSIDDGGWELVRHVSSNHNGFHPASDRLSGNDVYGTYDGNPLSLDTWSIKYSDKDFTQFMFSFGDCSEYLIVNKEEVLGSYYDLNDKKCILESSINKKDLINQNSMKSYSYNVEWYNREYSTVDPMITLSDFDYCNYQSSMNDNAESCLLYAGSNYGANGQRAHLTNGFEQHGGANEWIRNKDLNNENRKCPKYSDSCDIYTTDFTSNYDVNFNIYKPKDEYFLRPCDNNDLSVPVAIIGRYDYKCPRNRYSYINDALCMSEMIVKITDGVTTLSISYPLNGSPIYMHDNTPANGEFTLNNGKYRVIVDDIYFEMHWINEETGSNNFVKAHYLGYLYGGVIAGIDINGFDHCGQCAEYDNRLYLNFRPGNF